MTEPVARGRGYRLTVDRERLIARVVGTDGRPWFDLRLLHAVDTLTGPDETIGAPTVSIHSSTGSDGAVVIRVEAISSQWDRRWTELRCTPDGLSLRGGVVGRGTVLFVHALAGYRPPTGFLPSGSAVRSALSPNPDDPRQTVRVGAEPAVISVVGSGSEPGVGRWLFSPAPWCLAVSREPRTAAETAGPGQWAWIGIIAPIAEQNFTSLHFAAGGHSLAVRLDYEGHTEVSGELNLPQVDIGFGAPDPYRAVADYCRHLRNRGVVPTGGPPRVPDWWRQPLFCGWGAQRALAEQSGNSAPDECTARNYDRFLQVLDRHGIQPGTVVIDDKWSEHYATGEPDRRKWPDLRGWIAHRHARGQRVLLWWKAWDCEGAPADACVRLSNGTPVALDPESSSGKRMIATAVRRMLDARELNADGLKVDFTASTPSGVALRHAGPSWGSALLHELLSLVHQAGKLAKADSLIITHTPNPAFADVTDMIRLNDAVWLDAFDPAVDVSAQMTHRAAIVHAALPGWPIDTDGWHLPGRAAFRDYVARQPDIGVPALYYAGAFERPDHEMNEEDFGTVRLHWQRYRSAAGLSPP